MPEAVVSDAAGHHTTVPTSMSPRHPPPVPDARPPVSAPRCPGPPARQLSAAVWLAACRLSGPTFRSGSRMPASPRIPPPTRSSPAPALALPPRLGTIAPCLPAAVPRRRGTASRRRRGRVARRGRPVGAKLDRRSGRARRLPPSAFAASLEHPPRPYSFRSRDDGARETLAGSHAASLCSTRHLRSGFVPRTSPAPAGGRLGRRAGRLGRAAHAEPRGPHRSFRRPCPLRPAVRGARPAAYRPGLACRLH